MKPSIDIDQPAMQGVKHFAKTFVAHEKLFTINSKVTRSRVAYEYKYTHYKGSNITTSTLLQNGGEIQNMTQTQN